MTCPPRPPYIPLPYRFALDSSLSNAEFRVLVTLLGYYNQETECVQVTLPELVDTTGMGYASVARAIACLEMKGIITRSATNFGNVYSIAEQEEQDTKMIRPSYQNEGYLPLESNTIITHSDKHTVNNTVCDTTTEEFEEFWKAYPKPRNPDKTPRFKQHDTLRARSIAAVPLPFEFKKRRRLRGVNPRTPRFKPQCAVIFGFAPCGAEERSMNNGI